MVKIRIIILKYDLIIYYKFISKIIIILIYLIIFI